MASQPPLIMVDNVFDRINLYPLGTLSSPYTAVVGREIQYLADYRRERTYYQTASVLNPQVIADLGVGRSTAVDTLWIDRGHNLWGRTIAVDGSPDGHLITTGDPTLFTRAVPALGTVGGDPSTGWCVTEEGALYTFVTNAVARRSWRIYDTGTGAWIVPGVILGARIQLSSPAGYSSVLDEDAGERSDRTEASLVPGYEGSDRTYSVRKVELRLAMIGATEYDSKIRYLRRALFEINQPAVVCMNYGAYPERAWLYKYKGSQWSSPIGKGVYRNVTMPLYEYGPMIR